MRFDILLIAANIEAPLNVVLEPLVTATVLVRGCARRFGVVESMSASFFARALEHQPEPVTILVDGEILHRNRAWVARFGESARLNDCFQVDDRQGWARVVECARKERTNFVVKSAHTSRIEFRCTLWPIGDSVVALRAEEIVASETATPTCDEILASPEQTLSWMFRQIDMIVWAIRKDGVIVVSHGPGLAVHGLSDGQMVGANVFQIYPEGSNALEVTKRSLAGEKIHQMSNDGTAAWNQFCVPMRDATGDIVAMVGLSTSLSEDPKKLNYGTHLLEIINDLPIVVWAMKVDGTCTLSAGKLLEQFGFQSGDLVGKNLFEVYASVPRYAEYFHRTLGGEAFVNEETIGDRTYQSHYLPEKDLFGKVQGMYSVTQDITEIRRAEAEARVHEEQLASQAAALAEAVSPIIEVWQGVLVVPLIGTLEQSRASILTGRLLDDVVRLGATFTILDLTGVEHVDAETANHLFQIMRSVELLGCSCLVSGIRASVAQTMVSLDIPMQARTFSTLAGALRSCIRKSKG
ncbi:MAG TPA: PAS domain-containing protein [Polyangium sp.]|nr:PAS domain-containing protein [Polyangium sp.]